MNTYLIYVPLGQPSYPALLAGAVVICALGYYIYWLSRRQARLRCDVCSGMGREAHSITPRPCARCKGTGLKQSSQYSTYGGPADPVEEAEIRYKTSTLTTGQPVPTTQVRSGNLPVRSAPQLKCELCQDTRIVQEQRSSGAAVPAQCPACVWPQHCNLCNTDMQSPDDRLEWHGIGNCVPVCMPCAGSGKKCETGADGWPQLSLNDIAQLPDNCPSCPACDGRGYELPKLNETHIDGPYENQSATGVVAPGTLRITKIQSPELNALLEQTTYEHERSIIIQAYRLGRAQTTTPLPIASIPSQKPAGETTQQRPRADFGISPVEKLLTFLSCCDVCGAEAANLELNVQCDTCLGRTVTKLVDEWKNDIRRSQPIRQLKQSEIKLWLDNQPDVAHRSDVFVLLNRFQAEINSRPVRPIIRPHPQDCPLCKLLNNIAAGDTLTPKDEHWPECEALYAQIQATPIFKCDICRSTTTANHCDVVCHKDSCIQRFVSMNTLPAYKDVD